MFSWSISTRKYFGHPWCTPTAARTRTMTCNRFSQHQKRPESRLSVQTCLRGTLYYNIFCIRLRHNGAALCVVYTRIYNVYGIYSWYGKWRAICVWILQLFIFPQAQKPRRAADISHYTRAHAHTKTHSHMVRNKYVYRDRKCESSGLMSRKRINAMIKHREQSTNTSSRGSSENFQSWPGNRSIRV